MMFENIKRRLHGNAETMPASGRKDAPKTSPWDLTLQILRRLNCQYTEDKENGCIYFQYQGGHFITFANNQNFVNIGFPSWRELPLDDLDAVATMQRAVNHVNNTVSYATAFYSIDTEEGVMEVSAKCAGILTETIPQIDDYYQALLQSLFIAARFVDSTYEEERAKQGKGQ